MNDPEKLKGKLSSDDEATLEEAIQDGQSFLDSNTDAEKEEFDEKRKQVEEYFIYYLEFVTPSLKPVWIPEAVLNKKMNSLKIKDYDSLKNILNIQINIIF